MRMTSVLAAITAAVFLTACANQKEPAEQALAKVQASLSELKADAEQYAAEELKNAEQAVARLKAKLDSQDFSGVVQGAPSVASIVSALKEAVAKKKAEAAELMAMAQQEWTELSGSMPQLVDTLQKRVDSLTRSKRFPQGLDKAGFEAAKAEFETLKSSWSEATAEFGAGLATDAVRRGRAAKAKCEWLLQKFGA
jgi:DNA repair exonuclease SbcCD ATPase subunit